MSRQDKAVTERHAKALRELLKKSENKLCADCKRNDPRWASWNLGVFLCIRCSGIHRSMGTHISKVKSVDLDTWTPPQMEIISKWGNRLANKYWEAHLKAGHIPPDHKMDSFIRSKYETRRWALDGPLPEDPRVLDTDAPASPHQSAQQPPPAPPLPNQTQTPTPIAAPRHQLLSASHRQQPSTQQSQPQIQQQQVEAVVEPVPPPQNDLFSLDFHSSPTQAATASPTQSAAVSRNPKQDIMSLFGSSSSPAQNQAQISWSQPQQFGTQQQAQQQSMMGTNGVGMWGASSGWTPQQPQQSQNVWGDLAGGTHGAVSTVPGQQPQQPLMQTRYSGQSQPGVQPQMSFGGQQQIPLAGQQQLFGTNDIWASPTPVATGNSAGGSNGGQKDAFDDIWGGFK